MKSWEEAWSLVVGKTSKETLRVYEMFYLANGR